MSAQRRWSLSALAQWSPRARHISTVSASLGSLGSTATAAHVDRAACDLASTTLCIVTDAWVPQTNGVVTVLERMIEALARLGVTAHVVHPGMFRTIALPGYAEIGLAWNAWNIASHILATRPDFIHVATEGPLGILARWSLMRRRIPFTTAVHTNFPEYLRVRCGMPRRVSYAALRWFHRSAAATIVQSESQRRELCAHGLAGLSVVGGGVDVARFHPLPRVTRVSPKLLFVGRVAVEKDLPAFLMLDVPGQKTVVGDGPARAALQARFPHVHFAGYLHGDALVRAYADADVLVFPSRTDTFGLVMIEAMACGTPVAAFPVTGPRDVVIDGLTGALDGDLARAVERALKVDRAACRAHAARFSWERVANRFLALQVQAHR